MSFRVALGFASVVVVVLDVEVVVCPAVGWGTDEVLGIAMELPFVVRMG